MPNSKQRREAERRRLQRQYQRRQQQHATRRRIALITSIAGAAVVIAVVVGFVIATGNDNKAPAATNAANAASTSNGPSPSNTTSAPTVKPAAGTCTFKKSGTAARTVTTPPPNAPTKGTVNVQVKTTQGTMTFTLDQAKAPCAAENFVSLAKQKYFNSTPCHRLTTQGIFVLQCGDPGGTGSGGPGYSFADELSGTEKYTRGVLAMANSGADTNGSQFFIVYKNSTLGPQYTVFGTVTTGLSVVDKVAAKGPSTGVDGSPKLAISITSATVQQ
ncbi:MAG: peptidyl-prolyl cis-trans isomerase [Pseudonocardiales bacterium]|nr:peptidyl-prolyl cis-trans isomerase cyclophilin type [Jatrophihabitans sp.]MDT4927594.1 peptidyl-prolyl cis-trans isomerase [Pseudonocardiales bacterium]